MPVTGEAATAYARPATSHSVPGEAFTARTKRPAGPSCSCRAHTDTTARAMPGAKNVHARGSQVFMYGRYSG
ncbi:hypothetical protein GCM10022226_58500 [Sphaerisporangium flaviroseum]|uniref:Uncharacterized protein n=1 Tax=Sphaerisporangium flaviroseum TaxID=509199 RepID=A0ABP7IZ89_9ACTN